MLPPLPRCSSWVSSSLISPRRISLPRFHCRVGLHIDLFEVCSAFTHVAACTLAQSPYFVTAIRRLQTFRLFHACSGCFRRERIAGWGLHPLKSAALSRRTWEAVIRCPGIARPRCAKLGTKQSPSILGRLTWPVSTMLPARYHDPGGKRVSSALPSRC